MKKEYVKEAVDTLKNRYSCRRFSDKPIEDDVMNDILDVGMNAATGGNIQAVSVIQIKSKEQKEKIYNYISRSFVKTSDTLLIYVLDYYRMKRWTEVEKAPFGRQYSFRDYMIELEDVMCVAQSIECAATLLGVGSVYMGGINKYYDEFKEILDLPELTVPILMVCMGYPDQEKTTKKKLCKKLMVHNETYSRLTDEDVEKHIVKEKYNDFILKSDDEIFEANKKELYETTKAVNGIKWAEEVVKKVDEQGGVNKAQKALGLHYKPVRQHSYNKKIFEFYKKQGLHMLPGDDWFRIDDDINKE